MKTCPSCKTRYLPDDWKRLPLIDRLREHALVIPAVAQADLGEWIEVRACPCGKALTSAISVTDGSLE